MKKFLFIILVCINLSANEEIDNSNMNIDYINKTIDEDFQNCLKVNNFMDCDEERVINKGKAEIFEMNYKASEQLIKDRKIKEELKSQKYVESELDKKIDLAYDKCYKKAVNMEEQKACLKKIIIDKNTED